MKTNIAHSQSVVNIAISIHSRVDWHSYLLKLSVFDREIIIWMIFFILFNARYAIFVNKVCNLHAINRGYWLISLVHIFVAGIFTSIQLPLCTCQCLAR